MGFIFERLVRPALFTLDPEVAHERAVQAMALLGAAGPLRRLLEVWAQLPASCVRPVECLGLRFPNAVGLAAGFDKNGVAWRGAAALGFGHVEIGTVTLLRQPGNERPRIFRYPEHEAVINRMGFNNEGAEAVARRLARQAPAGTRRLPLGINLGKSRTAPLDRATQDYLGSFELLADHADYLVINVSSPNTPDLRKLQEEHWLRELLPALANANQARVATGRPRRPLLLKIAPDLDFRQIDAALAAIAEFGLDGIIATNTTLARPGPFAAVSQAGGLSGRPLRSRATEIIRYIARATNGRLPIIGSGGITDSVSAGEKLDAGAALVQIYTGMIYRGPFWAQDLARGLAARQDRVFGF
ncbi:MAG: quinone-dependent dihydroorotate dehydrogenase [Opitutaceae bacterium]|nr:quinone-dependent dihydroorotate dehydrogenase [Opitutaceae bacterium]